MSSPILSICIPTYNRREFLKVCLESITSQFSNEEIKNKVEIVISDNCSVDNTQELVNELQKVFTNIVYVKNSKNMGFDFNVLQVVSKASGEYCWLLGDDDALFPNSLDLVLNEINNSHLSYYIANSWGYDHSLLKSQGSKPTFNYGENKLFRSLADFIKGVSNYVNLAGYFGGMSAQIFKREIWQNFKDKEKYLNSQVVHFYIILITMRDQQMMVFNNPLVKTRAENINWAQVPGFETESKRTEKTKQGVIWIYNLYKIPYSILSVNWFFFKSKLRNRAVYIVKKFLRKFRS